MIKSRKGLKQAIADDRGRYNLRKPALLGWFFGDENFRIVKFLKILRYLEYYTNKHKHLYDYIPYAWYFVRYRRMRVKLGVFIPVNKIEPGLYIPHFSGGVYINCKQIGRNCIISSGCVLGNKTGCNDGPTLGNNVEVAIGAKIIGNVQIGDNVIVAPNSVVVKDVPSNCIVSGVPVTIQPKSMA